MTIISLKSPESSHLKRTIKDFSDGIIDVDDNDENDEEDKGDDGNKGDEGDKGKED